MAFERRDLSPTEAYIPLTSAGAGTTTGPDVSSGFGRGILIFVNITAIAGTSPTLTVTLQGKDPVSGVYYTILASSALTATGMTVMKVYPGLTAAANTVANDRIPPDFNIKAVVGGSGALSVTATISYAIVE